MWNIRNQSQMFSILGYLGLVFLSSADDESRWSGSTEAELSVANSTYSPAHILDLTEGGTVSPSMNARDNVSPAVPGKAASRARFSEDCSGLLNGGVRFTAVACGGAVESGAVKAD